MDTIAHRLRAALKRKGLSQQALAERIGVSQSAVKHWLSHHGPPMHRLAAVETALSLPQGYLLGHYDKPLSTELQRLLSFLQEGGLSAHELHTFLKVCGKLADSLDLSAPVEVSPDMGSDAAPRHKGLRLAEPGRPYQLQAEEPPAPRRRGRPPKPRLKLAPAAQQETVLLYKLGRAAASTLGRDWFDTMDEPARQAVAVGALRWLGVQQPLDPKRHYLLRVEGDSMEPLIPQEGLCVVAHSEVLMPGLPQVVAWREDGGDEKVAIKYIKQSNSHLVLNSLNPHHADLVLLERHQPRIRGHVVAVVQGEE